MSKTPVGAIFDDPAGLGSMLTRRPAGRRRVSPDEKPTVVEDSVESADTGSSAAPKQSAGERRPATKRPPATAPKRLPDTIVYVTPAQAESVRGERRRTGRTVTEIVLSAVESAAPGLPAEFAKPAAPVTGRLFQGSAAQTRNADPLGKVQLCLRMIKSDREALDSLTQEVGAPSRSHMVRQALEIWTRAKGGSS